MTHGLWERQFGADPSIVGKDVLLDRESYRVVGVLPSSFTFERPFELYVPFGFTPAMREESTRDQHFLETVGRLKPGVTVADANAELAVIGARLRAAHPEVFSADSTWRPEARPLIENLVSDVRPSLFLLAAAAALVLLIVCGNVASLLLARASTRQRELSVRTALGATRGRLVLQLLGESLFLSALGGVLGIVIAYWGTDLLLSLAPAGLPRAGEVRLDGSVLLFSVALTAVTGAIFGLIPAWGASRVDVQDALRAAGRNTSAGKQPRRVRHGLVIAETALALILVTSAALVTRSFGRVMDVEPGFRTDGILSLHVTLPAPTTGAEKEARMRGLAWFKEAQERLAALPGVASVGLINRLPLSGARGDRLLDVEDLPDATGGQRPDAQYRVVSPGYLETMAIPLEAGRTLAATDTAAGLPVVVVSKSFARKTWPDKDPLGKRMRLSSPRGPWMTVVGVVGDVHDGGLDTPAEPSMYAPLAQTDGAYTMAFVVRSTLPMSQLAGAVRAELARFDPQQPIYDVTPMERLLAKTVAQRRFVLVLFELFAGLALGLAALGLYGVLAHAVAERRREIGVRVALGATRASVLSLVAREGAILVGVGVALGIAGGLAGTRLLAHLLYDVTATDPLAIIAAIALLALASAVAMWLPLRRALRVDPMEALREE